MDEMATSSAERPKKRLRLRKNFSWMAAGQTVYLLCQWSLLAILAKFWNAEMVGQLSLAYAITSPIFRFSYLGMRIAQATDVGQDYHFRDYFGLRSFCAVIALLVVVGVIGGLDYALETALVIGIVALARSVEAQSDVFFGLFQSVERMDYIARSMMMRGPLAVVLFTTGLLLTDSLAVGVIGLVAADLTLFLAHDLPLGRSIARHPDSKADKHRSSASNWRGVRPRLNRQVMLRLAWLTLPLGLVNLLVALQINIPRYFIADHFGLEQLGYFAAMMYFYVASIRLMNTLGHSASARLARQYADGDRKAFVSLLAKLAGFAVIIGCPGLLLVAFAGQEILTLFYTAEYAAYPDVFLLIMIAAVIRFVAVLLQVGVSAARRFQVQFWNHLVITVVALAGSYLLVPSAGLLGAGLVVLVTAVCHLCSIAILNYTAIRALVASQPAQTSV